MIIHCPKCHSLEVESIASINDEDPRIDDFICENCGEMFEYIFPPDYDGDGDYEPYGMGITEPPYPDQDPAAKLCRYCQKTIDNCICELVDD